MSDITTLMMAAAGQGGEETDPNFNQTVLLLHGDGTNGAQNNTFLDSSTNNFTITRNGNTTQGTFSPFSLPNGEWSNYFDGSGDYLTVPDDVDFDLPADFTFEFWTYNPNSSDKSYFQLGDYRAAQNGLICYTSTNNLALYGNGGSILVGSALPVNAWTHIAVVRSGGGSNNLKIYVNGVQDGQATNTTSFTGVAGNGLAIGAQYGGSYVAITTATYISNFRLVKGTAVYTSAFTPPTSPLTAISGTSLLTCQSNRFVDNSSNAFAITANGNPSVQPFSPFLPTAEYDASVNGGSGYFDGSDTLSIAQTTATDLGNGNWTLESWVYPTAAFTNNARVFHKTGAGSDNWIVRFNATTGYPYLEIDASSIVTGNAAPPLNSWSHLAVVRNSNTVTIYLNGASVGSATYTGTPSSPSAATYVASNLNTNEFFTGYLANSRFVKGTAVYTSAFTPPTAPLTAIANTSFLLNFTNAGIFDNTGKNNLETVADAQIDTSVKKYGTGSIEFDGTGDALAGKPYPLFNFGTENFTVECWIYIAVTPTTQRWLMAFGPMGSGGELRGWGIRLHDGSAAGLEFAFTNNGGVGAHFNDFGSLPSATTWAHIAFCRIGSIMKCFVDGVQLGSDWTLPFSSINDTTATDYYGIGGYDDTSNGFPGRFWYDGLIDDLRITKGVARYTTTFTPPTAAFPNL